MKRKWIWIGLLIFGVIAAFQYVFRKILEEENAELRLKYIDLYTRFLSEQNVPEEIIDELKLLRDKFVSLDFKVEFELKRAIKVAEVGEAEIAFTRLNNIVENALKDKFITNSNVKSKKKCPSLNDMLKIALEKKWISNDEYEYSNVLRKERNKVNHQLAIKYPEHVNAVLLVIGIQLIHTLKGITYDEKYVLPKIQEINRI